jgi:26S proteasome regulatory subunit N13
MKKVNDALNNSSSLTGGSRVEAPDPEALMQILTSSNTNPAQIQQLQSLLQQSAAHRSQSRSSRKEGSSSKKEKKEDSNSKSSAPASTPAPKPEPTTPAAAGVKLEDLQNILSGLPAMQGSSSGTPTKPIDLAEAMKADDIIPLLANESIRDKCIEHLPQDASIPKTEAELKDTLRSPQFKQACDAFSHALSTGQLGPALQQFGVPAAAVEAANKGDVKGFAEAMEKDASEKTQPNDEQMQTD